MRQFRVFGLLIFLTGAALFDSGCRKDRFFTDASAVVEFSTDTLTFDTVFTDVGSITRWVKVYNIYPRSLEISRIELEGGNSSQFRINVDGISGTLAEKVVMAPNDSLYIFVEVTVD
ncbi:MAG: hypothetical protein IH946_08385, partial [Bacteroidetes bacterium]|nr:hypothetical protein [Bacteroidota bacterium]